MFLYVSTILAYGNKLFRSENGTSNSCLLHSGDMGDPGNDGNPGARGNPGRKGTDYSHGAHLLYNICTYITQYSLHITICIAWVCAGKECMLTCASSSGVPGAPGLNGTNGEPGNPGPKGNVGA